MTVFVFICGGLIRPTDDIRFLVDIVRLTKAIKFSHPGALIRTYTNTNSKFKKYVNTAIQQVVDVLQGDVEALQEADIAGFDFFVEGQDPQQPSPFSIIADDMSPLHTSASYNIYSTKDAGLMIGTQFLQKLLVFLSNYKDGEVALASLHDRLDPQFTFGGYYGANRDDSLWSYFGPNMAAYSSRIVHIPDIKYITLQKTFSNTNQESPNTILSRWTPRLQRLVRHLIGEMPSEKEVIPVYDGEFALFALKRYNISIEAVQKGVEEIDADFN